MSEIEMADERVTAETESAPAKPLVEEVAAPKAKREPSTRVMRCECAT